jgi:hypothetical protein
VHLESGAKPYFGTLYRQSLLEKKTVDKIIDELLDTGKITRSNSSWGAPILLVPKKDGQLRMCCDYRKLNKQTIKDRYALPLIDDLLDGSQRAQVYTLLDF